MVADGTRLSMWEQREARQPQQVHGVAQMVRALNEAQQEQPPLCSTARVRTPARSSVESTLSSLPPSVLAVVEADRNGGSFVPLRQRDDRRVGASRPTMP